MKPIKMDEVEEKVLDLAELRSKLHVVTGGKDGNGDWLSGLKNNTAFLVRDKTNLKKSIREYWIKLGTTKTAVILMNNMNEPSLMYPFEPVSFCDQYELVEILTEENDD